MFDLFKKITTHEFNGELYVEALHLVEAMQEITRLKKELGRFECKETFDDNHVAKSTADKGGKTMGAERMRNSNIIGFCAAEQRKCYELRDAISTDVIDLDHLYIMIEQQKIYGGTERVFLRKELIPDYIEKLQQLSKE